jgi:Phosphotransferase enzyme family
VIEGLYALMRDRTTILITHSIALARTAHRVIVLEDGRIVEDGSPDELLRRGGSFERLARTQEMSPARASTSVPRDPALPELGHLLETERMRPVLQRSLKEGLRDAPLEDLRIARVRYQPQQKVAVHYRTTIEGQQQHAVATVIADQDLAAKVHRPRYEDMATTVDGRSPASHPVIHDDEVNAIVTWLPFDVKLPGVAAASSELFRKLGAERVSVPKDEVDQPVIVGYKPESRAVMRLGDCVLKAYGKDRQFNSALAGLIASSSAPSIPSAGFVGAIADLRLTAQTTVSGTTPEAAVDAAHEAGAFLRHLQSQRFDGLNSAPPESQLREAERHAFVAGVVVPDLAPRVEELIAGLAGTVPLHLSLAPAHGDFHVDQLIVEGHRFAVIDFDGMCYAPAALDLATYAADVVRGRKRDLEAVTTVLDGLLDAYGTPPDGLSWYLCTAILARATHPFRAQTENWPQRVEAMVDAAEKALTR